MTKFFCENKNGKEVEIMIKTDSDKFVSYSKKKKTHKILFCKSSELSEVFVLTLWPHNESHQEVFSTIPQTDKRKTGGTSLLKANVKDPIDAGGESTPDRFVSFYTKTCILQRCFPAKVR